MTLFRFVLSIFRKRMQGARCDVCGMLLPSPDPFASGRCPRCELECEPYHSVVLPDDM